jgi:hypothetical protein
MGIRRWAAATAAAILLTGALTVMVESPAGAEPVPPPPGYTSIELYRHTNFCLGILPSTGAYGNQGDAVLWTCNGNRDQQWRRGSCLATSICQLVNANGQCLSVRQASTFTGARIAAGGCGTAHDKYWSYVLDGQPTIIMNYNSAMVATDYNSTPRAGDPVVQEWNGFFDNDVWLGLAV